MTKRKNGCARGRVPSCLELDLSRLRKLGTWLTAPALCSDGAGFLGDASLAFSLSSFPWLLALLPVRPPPLYPSPSPPPPRSRPKFVVLFCLFRLRDQSQWQSPAKTTHLTHASNTRSLGKDAKCLTAVGEPQVEVFEHFFYLVYSNMSLVVWRRYHTETTVRAPQPRKVLRLWRAETGGKRRLGQLARQKAA